MHFIQKTLTLNSLIVFIIFSVCAPAYAEKVRKIIHPDGRIEYTNLTDNQRQNNYTSNRNVTVTKIYKFRTERGVISYTDQRPIDFAYEVIRFDCYACNATSKVNWYRTPLNTKSYRKQVKAMSQKYSVNEALVRAVIHAESAFKVNAVSRAGAQGLMQLMPATANDLGVRNSLNADQNIEGGTKYLAELLKRFSGDTTLATAAYNAGPGAVTRYNGVPPYAETQAYVKRVEILKNRYAQTL